MANDPLESSESKSLIQRQAQVSCVKRKTLSATLRNENLHHLASKTSSSVILSDKHHGNPGGLLVSRENDARCDKDTTIGLEPDPLSVAQVKLPVEVRLIPTRRRRKRQTLFNVPRVESGKCELTGSVGEIHDP